MYILCDLQLPANGGVHYPGAARCSARIDVVAHRGMLQGGRGICPQAQPSDEKTQRMRAGVGIAPHC